MTEKKKKVATKKKKVATKKVTKVAKVDDDFIDPVPAKVPEKIEDLVRPIAEKSATQSTTYKNVSQLIVVVGRFKFLPNEAKVLHHKYLNELHEKKLKRLVEFDMLKKVS